MVAGDGHGLRPRHFFRDQERHRHREHAGLRVGEPCPDRRRLSLDLFGDFLGPRSHRILVPLEAFLLRVIEQHGLDVRRVFEFGFDGLLQFGEDGFDVLGFLVGPFRQPLLKTIDHLLHAGFQCRGQR